MADTITVNVSGRRFEIGRDVLSRFPDSTLGRLTSSTQKEVFFERPMSGFKSVLGYHQTGHLHVPASMCLGAVQDELAFWGLTINDLEPCCKRNLNKFNKLQRDLESFEKSMKDDHDTFNSRGCCQLTGSRLTKGRRCLWSLLDQPFSSILARIYFAVSSLMVVLSVVVVFLQSMEEFKKDMTLELWRLYYGAQFQEHEDQIRVMLSSSSAEINELLAQHNQTAEELITNFTLPDDVLFENEVFDNIGIFCTSFFMLELLLRVLSCPSITRFFKSIMNWVDILAVAFACSNAIHHHVSPPERFRENSLDYLGAFQILRVLRLFRLAKHVTGAKVLKYTVFTSCKEFGFMVLLIVINTIVFGTLVFTVNEETMKDLPFAAWWAIVTMTTVGYGDVVPSNYPGRFVGVLCAAMGIMTLALTVPLLVDNFVTFYSYASDFRGSEKVTKLKKDKVSPVMVSEDDNPTTNRDK
ncbi:potassium voltage-gated channel subfamily D member 3-like [Haliotis rufescens]|uniref:potassium voltage-gated channel subfamily D member 3-like n=1 Tax=Haliotis rufescens TaxID=6454 RepID=UPI00201ECE77|nr:potassium voltage-gated channel subfamily D member 3-like [Haliotis rufescens]